MKYKLFFFLYAGFIGVTTQSCLAEKTSFMGSVQFPSSITNVTPVRVFYNGQRLTTDLNNGAKKVNFTLEADKNKKAFYLLITSEKINPVKARKIAPDAEQNTIAYFKLSPKQNYKFYKITLHKEVTSDETPGLSGTKNSKKVVNRWQVSDIRLPRETGRIPDDAIMVNLNAEWVKKVEGGSNVEFPRIIIKKSILQPAGSERILHEEMTHAFLTSLDLDTLHANVRQEKRGDPALKTLIAMTT